MGGLGVLLNVGESFAKHPDKLGGNRVRDVLTATFAVETGRDPELLGEVVDQAAGLLKEAASPKDLGI